MLFGLAKKTSPAACRTLLGTALSPGLSIGKAYVYEDIFDRELNASPIEEHQVDDEYVRIERAVDTVIEDLRQSEQRVENELESALAEIFRTHQEMLQDAALTQEIRSELEQERVSAENALQHVFRRWEQRFRAMESETFRQRGDDVADLGRRLLRTLTGVRTHSLERIPKDTILVAKRLLPSEIIIFARRSAAGIVVEYGGPGSHCALLTREMGIPGVCQVPRVTEAIATGASLLLDGLDGSVTVSPDRDARRRFRKRMEHYRDRTTRARRHRHQPSDTLDGVHIPVMANVGNRRDAELAADNGADGIGLYRTEVIFMSRKMLPTEADLIEEIAYTVAPLKRKPLVIRLLDAGGDKSLPYLSLPAEDNPFLGRRGVRLLLQYPELLNVQLRALLQLSRDYNIQILVPMITLASDMRRVRDALVSAATELGLERVPPLGAMIETPAAALGVKAISPFADFLSIGTNDLTQYTMAAGRENPLVFDYFQDTHPSVLRLLSLIAEDAGDKVTCLCGELAGRCEIIPVLLRARIRMLSVAPPLIPSVKEAVRQAGASAWR